MRVSVSIEVDYVCIARARTGSIQTDRDAYNDPR